MPVHISSLRDSRPASRTLERFLAVMNPVMAKMSCGVTQRAAASPHVVSEVTELVECLAATLPQALMRFASLGDNPTVRPLA